MSCEPVGMREISERLNIKRPTLDSLRHRGEMPAPRWTVGGRPAWDWTEDIEPWARETGRL